MTTNMHFWSYLAQFFLEWKIFETKFYGELEHNFMFNNFFFKSFRVWDNLKKKF
jgi:hypothetical protein